MENEKEEREICARLSAAHHAAQNHDGSGDLNHIGRAGDGFNHIIDMDGLRFRVNMIKTQV